MNSPDRYNRSVFSLSPRALRWLSIAFIVLVCFAVYYNSLSNGFVTDDADQIVNNQWIRDLRHVYKFFVTDVWSIWNTSGSVDGKSNYYRPLMYVFYALDYRFFGLSPFAYHLTNLLFHCGVSVLVFVIVSELLERYRPGGRHTLPALSATVVFAVHPVHVETVSWIADITDVSCAFFVLLSFLLYIKSKKAGNRCVYMVSSALAFFAALLCKETALALLIIIPVFDLIAGTEGGPSPVKKGYMGRLPAYAPYILAAGIYFVMRTLVIGGITQARWHQDVNAYSFVLTDIWLFASYIIEMFFPSDLSYYHVFHPVSSIIEKREVVSIVILAAFAAAALHLSRKSKPVLLGFVFFLSTLAPALYIYALPGNVFTERYLYLPSFGFVLVIAAALDHFSDRKGVFAALIAGLCVTVFISSYSTICRNHVWKDNFTLYEDTVRKSPEGVMPQYNYGFELAKKGRLDEAEEHLKAAVSLEPRDYESHALLALVYEKKGLTEEAIKEYKTALELNPDYTKGHVDLGTLYLERGAAGEAILELETAVGQKPSDARACNNLAVAYDAKGMTDKAIEMYRQCLKVEPERITAHYNLALDYAKTGAIAEAVNELETTLRLKPDFEPARAKIEELRGAGSR